MKRFQAESERMGLIVASLILLPAVLACGGYEAWISWRLQTSGELVVGEVHNVQLDSFSVRIPQQSELISIYARVHYRKGDRVQFWWVPGDPSTARLSIWSTGTLLAGAFVLAVFGLHVVAWLRVRSFRRKRAASRRC